MFWSNYEFLCKSVRKSPNAVAAEVGCKSSGSVSAWKNKGTLPRQSTLEEIAKYFGIDVDTLVDGDVTKKPVLKEDERDKYVSVFWDDLTPEEAALVNAYVSGLRSSRKL